MMFDPAVVQPSCAAAAACAHRPACAEFTLELLHFRAQGHVDLLLLAQHLLVPFVVASCARATTAATYQSTAPAAAW